jgi:hypothetical protein
LQTVRAPDAPVVAGQPRPDSADPIVNFAPSNSTGSNLPPIQPSIAAGGQVAFVEYSNANPAEAAIYLGDGTQTIQVARWGIRSTEKRSPSFATTAARCS